MSIGYLDQTSKGSTGGNSVTTDPMDTTSADLLVACLQYYWGVVNPATLTDSKGNTWTLHGGNNTVSPTVSVLRIYTCFNPTTDAAHTFTVAENATYAAISVLAFVGAAAYEANTSAIVQGGSGAGDLGASAIQPGSITPAENNELLITALGRRYITSTANVDSGFTKVGHVVESDGNHLGLDVAFKIQSTAAAINPTWSWTTIDDCIAAMLAITETPDASNDFDIGDVDLALSGALAIPAGTVSIFDTSDEFTLDNPLSMALQGALAMEGDIDFGVSRLALGNVSLALSGELAVPAGSIDYHVPVLFDLGDVDLALSGALHVTGIVHSKTDAVISSALIRRRSRRR
jgi:hypothetical protein